MAKPSAGKIVRKKAGQIPATSPEELARMLAIPDESIDLTDIPEQPAGGRLTRDEAGRLPVRPSFLRDAIAAAMAERNMSTYALWKEAKATCPTISETAVGEFLKGKRQIGLAYLETLMTVTGLTVVPKSALSQKSTGKTVG